MSISRRMTLQGILLAGAFFYMRQLEAQVGLLDAQKAAITKAEGLREQAAAVRKRQTKKDLVLARSLYEQSATLFEAGGAHEPAAEAYFESADISILFSRYPEARQTYAKIMRLDANEARCRAKSRTSRTYATTGPVALADRTSNDAVQFCRGLGQRAEAEALEARGEALESAGDHSQSAEFLERAAKTFDAMGDEEAKAESLLMLAAALYSEGKQEQSFAAAAEALQLWTSLDDHYGVGRIRAALGTFAIARGEFETAQCNYKIAEPLLRDVGNRDEEASVLNGLGYVSREVGDAQKSLEYYEKARSGFASIEDLYGEHEAIAGMGKTLLGKKRYKDLLLLYKAELHLANQSGDPALIASSLGDMGALYEAEEKYNLAERYYRRALSTYRNVKHLYGEGDMLLRLGRLQAFQGKYAEALTLLGDAEELKERTGQIEEEAKIQFEKTRILMRLDRLEEAMDSIKRTINIVERQRVAISQFDSRASYFAFVHRYYALYIELLMRLHAQNPDLGFAKRAFEASERSKVRSLLDLLTTSAQNAACGDLLAKQLSSAGSAMESEWMSGQEMLAPTVTLEQTQAQLESGTILLEYALGEDRSFLWVVGQHDMVAHELPKAALIRKLVEVLRTALVPPRLERQESVSEYQERAHKMDREFGKASRELSRLVLGPAHLDPAKRVLIVPDGTLQYTPFAALPDPKTNGTPLIGRYEVDILPSISVLETVRKATEQRPRPTSTIAIFADPVFERDDPRVPHRGEKNTFIGERPNSLTRAILDTGGRQYIARLPASRDEAEAIAGIFQSHNSEGVQLALDFDASRDHLLKTGLSQFQLIHFATHGVVDAEHPELSGLILSLVDVRGSKQDGYLRIGDIYQLKLAADLAVLSSCESAMGKNMESEGIIGLPRAFLYAGAKSVIASSWKVDDEATARLMSALYTRIRNGEGPGSALRGAQLEMVRNPRFSKPYYWAAFSVQGEYR